MAKANPAETDVAIREEIVQSDLNISKRIADFNIADINSPEDFERILGIPAAQLDDYVITFPVVDKDSLVGVPLFFLEWRFNTSTKFLNPETRQPLEFVSVLALNMETKEKVVFNDGSTGIMEQLKGLTMRLNRNTGLMVERGLRRNEYPWPKDNPTTTAVTFYIA